MKNLPTVKRVFKHAILLLILYFLARYLIENWHKIDESKYPVDGLYFSLSLISILGALFFLPVAFGKVVVLFNYRLPLKKMGTLLFYSQIAKYLPGGVWGYLGRVYLYKKEGIKVSDASTCVFLETLITIISGLFVFFMCMFFIDKIPSMGWINKPFIASAGLCIMLCLLLILHPRILNWTWKLIPARFRIRALPFDYGYFSIVKPAAILILFWLGVAVGFWLLIKSFYFVDFHLLPMTTGAYIAAWIIGLAAFFTPGGLGVREACLVLLLSLYLPVHMAAFVAVMARIWWVIGELIWAFFFFILNWVQVKS